MCSNVKFKFILILDDTALELSVPAYLFFIHVFYFTHLPARQQTVRVLFSFLSPTVTFFFLTSRLLNISHFPSDPIATVFLINARRRRDVLLIIMYARIPSAATTWRPHAYWNNMCWLHLKPLPLLFLDKSQERKVGKH